MIKRLEERATIITDNTGLNNQIIFDFRGRAGERSRKEEEGRVLYRIEGLPRGELNSFIRRYEKYLSGIWYEIS